MILIHPEDSNPVSKEAIKLFIEGFKPRERVSIINDQSHFPGDRWQRKASLNDLAKYISYELIKGNKFIIHYDGDIPYSDYVSQRSPSKLLVKEKNFNQLKSKVEKSVKKMRPNLDASLITKNLAKMVSYVDIESWFFVNKSILHEFMDESCFEKDDIQNLIALDISNMDDIKIKDLSKFFLSKDGERGKDIFNTSLMRNYPYDKAIKEVRSIAVFYNNIKSILSLSCHI